MRKKLFTLLMLLCPLLCVTQALAADRTIYFKPNTGWTTDGARFALYMWKSNSEDNSWCSFEAVGSTGDYKATLTDGYDKMKFVRMNGSASDNNWDNKWDEAGNLDAPTLDNQYYVDNTDTWDNNTTYTITTYTGANAIASLQLSGSFNDWGSALDFTTVTADTQYTLSLDLSETTADVTMKLRPNGYYVGKSELTAVDAPSGWVDAAGDGYDNIVLKNSNSGYKKYLLTATWAKTSSATTGWTLKVEGTEERTEPHTYTVVGNRTEIFGTAWASDLTDNDMEKQADGTYKWTKTGVTLPKYATIQYKVAQDHGWTTTYGDADGNNLTKTIDADGVYTITVTLDLTKAVGSQALLTAEKTAEAVIARTYRVVGAFGADVAENTDDVLFTKAWAPAQDGNEMTLTDGKYVWTKNNVTLALGTFYYKVAVNGTWEENYGKDGYNTDAQNYVVTTAGKYNVTITYDPAEAHPLSAVIERVIEATRFTVAGSNSTLFDGYYWEAKPMTGEEYNTVNDMTLTDGVWTITKTGKLLQAGNIEWKVAFDNDYDSQYGGIKGGDGDDRNDPGTTNAVLNIPTVGTYTVTFTYNPTTYQVAATATKTADYTITSWYIAGNSAAGNVLNAGDWGFDEANKMTAEGDGKTWKLVKAPVTFTAGTFEFKAFANKENIVTYPGSNATLTITEAEAAACDYTLTFTLDTEAGTVVAEKTPYLYSYTVTYVNTKKWENVYAYAWTKVGDATTEYAGPFPGTAMTPTGTTQTVESIDYDVYTITIQGTKAPANILFNNGKNGGEEGQEQTADFTFTDGEQYKYPITNTFTVVGAVGDKSSGAEDVLFGQAWTPSLTANDMTKDGDNYTLTKTDIKLKKGNVIYYKVAVNDSWTENYGAGGTLGGDNLSTTVDETAIYKVVFTFDGTTHVPSIALTKTAEVVRTYYIVGEEGLTGFNWTTDESRKLVDGELTLNDVELAAKNWEFKVLSSEGEWYPEGMDNNAKVPITEEGKYDITFSFNEDTKAVSATVTAKEIKVPAISAVGYATYSSAHALDFTGFTDFDVYIAPGMDDQNRLQLSKVEGAVPAATGLLLAKSGGAESTYVPVATGEVSAVTNLLKASVEATEVAASTSGCFHYFLANGSNGVGFYNLATSATSAANKAYLETTEALKTAAGTKVVWIFDDETTGIGELTASGIEDSKSAPMYNLSGQRVGNDYKGIVIVNGKKVIKK